jgi:hypothetical protein
MMFIGDRGIGVGSAIKGFRRYEGEMETRIAWHERQCVHHK